MKKYKTINTVAGIKTYFLNVFAAQNDDRDYWWRAIAKRYADYDPWAEFEQPNSSTLHIEILPIAVEKHTAKGVWLEGGIFVLGTAAKQYAVPTIDLAIRDLVLKKEKHVIFAEKRLNEAQFMRDAALDAKATMEKL